MGLSESIEQSINQVKIGATIRVPWNKGSTPSTAHYRSSGAILSDIDVHWHCTYPCLPEIIIR